MLLAVCCDVFDVYLPGITYLIPEEIKKAHYLEAEKPPEPIYTREQVIIINNSESTP